MSMIATVILSLAHATTPGAFADNSDPPVTWLTQESFRYGTFLIDQPGIYRLAEDISFNPNSPATLQVLCDARPGDLPADFRCPADAFQSGMPLPAQFQFAPGGVFTPGGPRDPRYDPAAFGLGFFAAIAISANNVTLDLNGFVLEQSEEHALLQRFFSVVELANQPFVPSEGPSDFGSTLNPATEVHITNGVIGRSAHHGIHGNGNERVLIEDVKFRNYEVAAVALNGVDDILIRRVEANNRLDVPVLGTFSSARFIQPYLDFLMRTDSNVVLNDKNIDTVWSRLRNAINRVHDDVIVRRHLVAGRPQIDEQRHAEEFALFNNPFGVVDGNAYSFVINPLGVAVNGFPVRPEVPARHVAFEDVHVRQQHGAVAEVVALAVDGGAATDPIGAVFQTRNRDTYDQWVTIADDGSYRGNAVADAQALVAKAIAAGEFENSNLSVARNSISPGILAWVEGNDATPDAGPSRFLCNGDSMFHVNKGVIAFKIDGADDVILRNTSARDLKNIGPAGSSACGDYSEGYSHPAATLTGYGGGHVRGYTFAGSQNVWIDQAKVIGASASFGKSVGIDLLTDTQSVRIDGARLGALTGGAEVSTPLPPPNQNPAVFGIHISPQATGVSIDDFCARLLFAPGASAAILDASGVAQLNEICL